MLVYFFKELISFIGSLDKCHTSVFNALITVLALVVAIALALPSPLSFCEKLYLLFTTEDIYSKLSHLFTFKLFSTLQEQFASSVVVLGASKDLLINPLPDMPVLDSSNSTANIDVVSKKYTNRDTII